MTLLPRRHDDPTPVPPKKNAPAAPADPVAKAQEAYGGGRYGDAVVWLRKAVEQYPFRSDLREMLIEALHRKDQAERAPKPEAVRGRSRGRLFAEPEYIEDEPSAQIEALHFDAETVITPVPHEREMMPAVLKVQRAAISAGVPASNYGSRRPAKRKRKASFIWIAVPMLGVLAAGVVWFARKEPTPGEFGIVPIENEVVADAPPSAEREIIERAGKYFETNEFALAIEQLAKLPDGPDKSGRMAAAYAKQGAAEFKTADEHIRHGDSLLQASSLNDARRSYEKALEFAPRDPGYLTEVGRISLTLGRAQQVDNHKGWQDNLTKAERNLGMALDVEPTFVPALEASAKLEIARDNRAAAEKYYRRILLTAPDSPQAASAKRNLEQWGLKP